MPAVRRVKIGPAAFILSWSDALRKYSGNFGGMLRDLKGALDAEQWGTASLVARYAVEAGIDTFLADHGVTDVTDDSRFIEFRRLLGASDRRYQEGYALVHESPATHGHVADYAARCVTYVESALSLKPPRFYMGRISEIERRDYNRLREDLDEVAKYLGLHVTGRGMRNVQYKEGLTL